MIVGDVSQPNLSYSPSLGPQTAREVRRRTVAKRRNKSLYSQQYQYGTYGPPIAKDDNDISFSSPDALSATWYEWGVEAVGTDKGGNTWTVGDLGIQY